MAATGPHQHRSMLVVSVSCSPYPHRHCHQGLKFRRNFVEFRRNFSFPLGTGKKYFGIFKKFRFKNSKFKEIRPKFSEIHRNSGIPFPPITGILPENEMVNPAATSPYPPVQ